MVSPIIIPKDVSLMLGGKNVPNSENYLFNLGFTEMRSCNMDCNTVVLPEGWSISSQTPDGKIVDKNGITRIEYIIVSSRAPFRSNATIVNPYFICSVGNSEQRFREDEILPKFLEFDSELVKQGYDPLDLKSKFSQSLQERLLSVDPSISKKELEFILAKSSRVVDNVEVSGEVSFITKNKSYQYGISVCIKGADGIWVIEDRELVDIKVSVRGDNSKDHLEVQLEKIVVVKDIIKKLFD